MTPISHIRMLTMASIMVVVASAIHAETSTPLPGLSVKDRGTLASNMVQQGQCKNALVETAAGLKEAVEDETLLRVKGVCEVELGRPEAKDTITRWLKLAPQTHPERSKMLALLAKTQSAKATPIEWLVVPAGEFEMGAEGGVAAPDEGPKHKVHLDAFSIGKYEVTNAQYHTFVKATGHPPPQNCCDAKFNIWQGDAMLDGIAELPVINVSWDDAVAFCQWAGGRLPTEAEWEKAARGTDSRTYPWGNDAPTVTRANYSADPVSMWDGPTSLSKKGRYEFGRSPYGVYEMAGNVWEWVHDWYEEQYYKSNPSKNPTGPATGQERVIRGGSWRNTAEVLRASNRNKHAPGERRVYIGIRCAKGTKHK